MKNRLAARTPYTTYRDGGASGPPHPGRSESAAGGGGLPPLEVILPLPPSANRLHRAWQHRVVLSPAAKRYRRQVDNELERLGRPGFGAAAVVVSAEVSPSLAGMDADNGLKALLDALSHAGVWDDDAQVCELHVWRLAAGGEPGVRVCIETAP